MYNFKAFFLIFDRFAGIFPYIFLIFIKFFHKFSKIFTKKVKICFVHIYKP